MLEITIVSALSAGVSAGIGPDGLLGNSGLFGGVKSAAVQEGLRGAVGSAVNHGIATATGLQDKFSFAGVAAAGVAAGVEQEDWRRSKVRTWVVV